MKLFYASGACSLAPHIVIREAGLDVELDKVSFGAERRTADGRNFYDINPQGAVPALELDNGEVLTEAQVLIQYLASLAPAKNLAPQDGMARWRLLETLNFIATELHKGTSPLFKKPLPEVREAAVKNLVNRFGLLDGKLGDKPYLLGDFTIADAYAFVMLRWARAFEIDLSSLPRLQSYYQRVQQRPAVQQTLQEEDLPTS
ncbi:glutathione transferase GstA [Terricaulis silvestris]|uniref:Glutathione S-transferase GST-6.0 n=1 Tax=Terricaulis silvestris TaxID=2686094 RepID=A0A6I6MUK5_9CAUL|nr:glutathione transferase GstA [Terricaulis silvestris]QGZ96437.1 Glutathione S-transferase GST-6.0 [Terricaulis silvestris]